MTRRNLLSVVFSFVFAFSLAGSAFAADASTPEIGDPASEVQLEQTAHFFDVLGGRFHRHDQRAVELFTDNGKIASFGTDDPVVLEEILTSSVRMVVVSLDVRVQDDQSLSATVNYTGIGDPLTYVTGRFRLLETSDTELGLLIDGFELLPYEFPKGKAVEDITLNITQDGFSVKAAEETIEKGDFLLLRVNSELLPEAPYVSIGIYRLIETSYEATVQAGQPLRSEDLVAKASFGSGQSEFAFVGLEPGEYMIANPTSDSWAAGPTTNFQVK